MRLLVVTQYYWPENFRINDLTEELTKRGHEVTVLTGLPSYPEGKIFKEFNLNPNKFSSYHHVKIVRVPILPRGQGGIRLILNYLSFVVTGSLLGAWKLRGQKFDFVFTYQPSPITVGLVGALMARIHNVPMAMWVLDLWPDTLKALGVIKSKSMLDVIAQLVKFIYRRCDLIFAQSKSFIPNIRLLSNKATPVLYFPSWSEKIFNENSVIPAAEVQTNNTIFTVMFAGNIGEAQDFECILSAAALLNGNFKIRWLIVGDGRAADWVRAQIELRNLNDCVFLLGRYPVNRMPEFYAHADAMLVTLKNEDIFSMTIPGKLQSYLAAGIPIIAALNGEGAEIIKQADAGLVCSAGDAIGLSESVKKMSKMSKDVRLKMGENGLNFSQLEFERDKVISFFEKSLLKFANGKF